MDAEDEGCLEQEDEVNNDLEDKALTERFDGIIIPLWDISESATV